MNMIDRVAGRWVLRLSGVVLLAIGALTGYLGATLDPGPVSSGPAWLLFGTCLVLAASGGYCMCARRKLSEL